MNGAPIWNSQSANKKSEEMKAMAANVLLENFSIISSRNQGPCFAWNVDLLLFLCGDNSIFCHIPLVFSWILYSGCLHGTWKGKGEKVRDGGHDNRTWADAWAGALFVTSLLYQTSWKTNASRKTEKLKTDTTVIIMFLRQHLLPSSKLQKVYAIYNISSII